MGGMHDEAIRTFAWEARSEKIFPRPMIKTMRKIMVKSI